PGMNMPDVYFSPMPMPADNPAAVKPSQGLESPPASAVFSKPKTDPSTNSDVVRSFEQVPSRDTKPAPETPIRKAPPRKVQRSPAAGMRMTWQAIAKTIAALMPCTAPMMKATMRGISFRGDEISP